MYTGVASRDASAPCFSGCDAGADERVDDVPQLPGEGSLQVVQNGPHHVLRRGVAGAIRVDFCSGAPLPSFLICGTYKILPFSIAFSRD